MLLGQKVVVPKLTVIIVNWNGAKFLPDCLRSIADNPPSMPYEAVVVDNVSTDGSREWLGSDEAKAILGDGRLRVILSDENLGFGKANNLAIKKTKGEFVFILNPDTIVKPHAIDRLLQTLQSDGKIGAVSPKLLNPDGTLQASVAGFPPNPATILVQGFRLTKLFPRRFRERMFYGEEWLHDKQIAVPVFWGTAILAKREMIEKVGSFDEDFFMYGEDVEWCARINRKGWTTVFVPVAEVIHLGGKSSEQAWEASETTLRKDAADILVQKKSLPAWLAATNSLTKAGVYSAALLRRSVFGRETAFLKRHIRLQLSGARSAISSDKNPEGSKE